MMKNVQALDLLVGLFGAARLTSGGLEDDVSPNAIVTVMEDQDSVLFETSTIRVLWALQGAGIRT